MRSFQAPPAEPPSDAPEMAAADAPAQVIALPERLDFAACEALAEQIGAAQGKALQFDANDVAHVGALPVELLLRARAACDAADLGFCLRDPSRGFTAALERLGFNLDDFNTGVTP